MRCGCLRSLVLPVRWRHDLELGPGRVGQRGEPTVGGIFGRFDNTTAERLRQRHRLIDVLAAEVHGPGSRGSFGQDSGRVQDAGTRYAVDICDGAAGITRAAPDSASPAAPTFAAQHRRALLATPHLEP